MATFLADELNWNDLGLVRPTPPPGLLLPGMNNFDQRVAGRQGDVLVIQVKSSVGAKDSARGSMRSLGLSGIGSFSLRLIGDPIVRGYIRAAKDYVGVLDLGSLQYREQVIDGVRGGEMYERPYYGSNTNPAQLVRDVRGNYFQYESSSSHLLVAWNSPRELVSCLELFREIYGDLEASKSRESLVSIASVRDDAVAKLDTLEVTKSSDTLIVDAQTSVLEPFIRENSEYIRVARLAFDNLEVTWQAQFPKFDDRETEFCEVGLIGPPTLDITAARTFASATGVPQFFEDARCQVEVRSKSGTLTTKDF